MDLRRGLRGVVEIPVRVQWRVVPDARPTQERCCISMDFCDQTKLDCKLVR